ncbi:hypothetical protein TNCV_3604041 [Trichonephila clavipes]|nr:hypothetical protein TNCV_3604041 [Trichonephila clavipes]
MTDHLILNHGQVTWITPELAPPTFPNYHTTPTGGRLSSRQTKRASLPFTYPFRHRRKGSALVTSENISCSRSRSQGRVKTEEAKVSQEQAEEETSLHSGSPNRDLMEIKWIVREESPIGLTK